MGLKDLHSYFSIPVGEPGKDIIHKEGSVLKLDLVSSLHALVWFGQRICLPTFGVGSPSLETRPLMHLFREEATARQCPRAAGFPHLPFRCLR